MAKLTKKQEALLERYNDSNLTTLHECYGSWSWAKEHAYNDCVARMEALNGYGFKIISYNTSVFTIGFRYQKDGKEFFHYETDRTILDFEIGEGDAYDYEDFKKDYDALGEETKKHLANSGVCVGSMQEAKDIMKISKKFDILFKM